MCRLQYDCVTSLLVTRRWPQFSFKTVAEERRGVNRETFCREMLKRYNNDINLCWSSKWQIWMMYRAQCCLIVLHCINQAAGCFLSLLSLLEACWKYVNIYIVLALDVGLLELKMCMIVLFLFFIFHKTFELIDRVPPWLPSCSQVASLNL